MPVMAVFVENEAPPLDLIRHWIYYHFLVVRLFIVSKRY
jgi:hypothetical protein